MSTALAPRSVAPGGVLATLTLPQVLQIAEIAYKSGMYKDLSDANKGVIKILTGIELGIGPMAALAGIYVIEGKPVLSANLIATLIQNSGRFSYYVERWDDTVCSITFSEGDQLLGVGTFTMEQARKIPARENQQQITLAQKSTWKAYPASMLFARALTMGARAFCPGVFGGAPAYASEEINHEAIDAQSWDLPVAEPPAPLCSADQAKQIDTMLDAIGQRGPVAKAAWLKTQGFDVPRVNRLSADDAEAVLAELTAVQETPTTEEQ